MKTTRLSVLLAVAFAFIVPIQAQHHHGDVMKKSTTRLGEELKDSSMANMVGTPTFEKSQDGVHIAVWLITQEDHKKMMEKRMKDGKHPMKMDHGMMHDSKDTSTSDHMMHDMEGMEHGAKHKDLESAMDAMMSGTHHIMVTVTDEKSRKEITEAEVSAVASIPGKKTSPITLSQMMNHFGGGLVLQQKSTYTIIIMVMSGEKHLESQFSYEVQ